MSNPARLAEVVRNGLVECVHYGALVVLSPGGQIQLARGDVDALMFPRSSNKLMQASGMLGAGLDLVGPQLAVAASSHSGQAHHLAAVRQILAGAGLSEADLQTPADLPLGEAERDAALRAGVVPAPILMDCSGKHAAMLATCRANGWPTSTYLSPLHPVQQAARDGVEALSGETVRASGVDGCGAPVLALTLPGLARAFSAAVQATAGSPARRVADAMREFPEYVGGTDRDVTRFMAAVPGLLLKDGAEGVYAGALADGTAFAVKVSDGAERASQVVVSAVLRWLGVRAEVVEELGQLTVLGGGRPVGAVGVAPDLLP